MDMTLILFDIDGTLTATSRCDADCYAAAFERTFSIPLPTTDWHAYKFVTDTGIITEVLETVRGAGYRFRGARADATDA